MIAFLLRRLGYGILVLFGVVSLVFFLFSVLPSDPARLTLGQRSDQETLENVRKQLGLDKPLHIQYLNYLNDLSPISYYKKKKLDRLGLEYSKIAEINDGKLILKASYLRRSYQTQEKVNSIISRAFPQTALLAISSLFMASVLGILFGVISALRKYSIADHGLMITAIIGISTPSFFSSIIIAWLFGFVLSDLTGLNMHGGLYSYDAFEGKVLSLQNLILPAVTLGIRPLAIITQLTRGSMIEVLNSDYIRTATAKGLSDKVVVFKHSLRNALNPVLTAVSGWLASLLGGAFFVEYIFDWKGLGKVTIDALAQSDLPVVMGSVLFVSCIFVGINILVDLAYGVLDPRVRLN